MRTVYHGSDHVLKSPKYQCGKADNDYGNGFYTTEYEDTFLLEPIAQDDFRVMKKAIQGMRERTVENEIEYEMEDKSSGIEKKLQIVKIRKLNRKIGENLKLLYGYRCQICGQVIGEKYGSHIAEAHHIDYFVNSLNNDANNQMIVCPNHHSVIHDANPVFDRRRMVYGFDNGVEERIILNKHLVQK